MMKQAIRNPWVQLVLVGAGIVTVVWGLLALSGVLTPFAVAFVLAYFLNPAVNALEGGLERLLGRRPGLRRRVHPRTVAVALLALAVLAALAAGVWLVVPVVARQVGETAARVPEYAREIRTRLEPVAVRLNLQYPEQIEALRHEVEEALRAHWREVLSPLRQLITAAFSGVLGFVLTLLNVLVVPVVTLYLLLDMNRIRGGLADLVPPRFRPYVYSRFGEMDGLLSAFVRGQLTVALILGAFYAVGLTLCDVPMGLLVGFVIGLFNLIPYMSYVLGLPLALVLSWLDDQSPQRLLAVAAVFVVGQFIEGNFITPRIVGQRLGLHAVVIMLAVLVFGTLFGFVGMVVAVPLTGALAVFLRDLRRLYLESAFYRGSSPGARG